MKFHVPAKRVASKLAAGGAIAAFAVAAVVVTSPAALAGTSATVYGCYSTWGSTGSNAHCQSVTKDGDFQNYAYCDYSSDQNSVWSRMYKGDSHSSWGQVDCLFSVDRSWINYRGL